MFPLAYLLLDVVGSVSTEGVGVWMDKCLQCGRVMKRGSYEGGSEVMRGGGLGELGVEGREGFKGEILCGMGLSNIMSSFLRLFKRLYTKCPIKQVPNFGGKSN